MASTRKAKRSQFHAVHFDEPIYAAVGWLVIEWAAVENFLSFALHELMVGHTVKAGEDVTGYAVIVGMKTQTKIGLMKTLAGIRFEEPHTKQLCVLLNKIDSLQEKRDAVAHWQWKTRKSRLYVHTLKTVGQMRRREFPMSIDEMHNYARQLHEHHEELISMLHGLGYLKRFVSLRNTPD